MLHGGCCTLQEMLYEFSALVEDAFPIEIALVAKYGEDCLLALEEEETKNQEEAEEPSWDMHFSLDEVRAMRLWRATYVVHCLVHLAQNHAKKLKFSDNADMSGILLLSRNMTPATMLSLASLDERALSRVAFAQVWSQIIAKAAMLVDDANAIKSMLICLGMAPNTKDELMSDITDADEDVAAFSVSIADLYRHRGDSADVGTDSKKGEATASSDEVVAQNKMMAQFASFDALNLKMTATEIEFVLQRRAKHDA